jgi:uncharacterized protein YndB with AHSA1/START domain
MNPAAIQSLIRDAGMLSHYEFVTHWMLAGPIEAVWDEISQPDHWPQWWRGVLSVDLIEPGDPDGLGSYRRISMRSALPYRLTFNIRTVRLDRPRTIEARADGELAGVGLWTLTSTPVGTAVRYDWRVDATKPWMRRLAPIARPVFAWNHDVIMRWGLEGLQRRLTRRSS